MIAGAGFNRIAGKIETYVSGTPPTVSSDADATRNLVVRFAGDVDAQDLRLAHRPDERGDGRDEKRRGHGASAKAISFASLPSDCDVAMTIIWRPDGVW